MNNVPYVNLHPGDVNQMNHFESQFLVCVSIRDKRHVFVTRLHHPAGPGGIRGKPAIDVSDN